MALGWCDIDGFVLGIMTNPQVHFCLMHLNAYLEVTNSLGLYFLLVQLLIPMILWEEKVSVSAFDHIIFFFHSPIVALLRIDQLFKREIFCSARTKIKLF